MGESSEVLRFGRSRFSKTGQGAQVEGFEQDGRDIHFSSDNDYCY